MLGQELNGLLFAERPPEQSEYPFRVTEHYYGQGRGGTDLVVSYVVKVPARDVQFTAYGEGALLGLRPSAFLSIQRRAEELQINDVGIYPAFGVGGGK